MALITMKIPADTAEELFDLRHEARATADGRYVAYDEEQGDDRRWSRTNSVIFRDVNTLDYWAFDYEEGLTENQENEYPWSYTSRWDNDLKKYVDTTPTEVEAYRVEPVEIKAVTWQPVKA